MKYILVKKYWYLLVIIIFVVFIKAFGLVFSAFSWSFAIQYLVDGITPESMNKFYLTAALIVASGILGYVFSYISNVLSTIYVEKVQIYLKTLFICNLNNKSYWELKEMTPGICHNWINNDIRLIQNQALYSFTNSFDVFFFVILSVAALAILNWIIAIIALVLALISVFLPVLLGKKLNGLGEKLSQDSEKHFNKVYKIISGINNLFLLGRLDLLVQNIKRTSKEYCDDKTHFSKQSTKLMAPAITLSVISQIILIVLVAVFSLLKIPSGSPIVITAIFSITPLAGNIFGSLQSFINGINQITMGKSIIVKNIDKNLITKYKHNKNVSFDTIDLKNVSLIINDKQILKDINLSFQSNKKYLIIGESGCGKSTLVSLLMKMNNDYKGFINVDNDKELKDINYLLVNDNVSYLSNKGYFFDDSIKNNISIYADKLDNSLFENSLKLSNCDFINQDNLDKVINDREFSTGQLQRLLVARSLYQNKKILIFDEALSNLDKVNTLQIEKNILDKPDITFIHITHHTNHDLIKQYDKVIYMDGGKIV